MVNINEAKAKLSEYLEAAGKGERVVICRHNRPVAELRALENLGSEPRDLTPMFPGATFMTARFFDPLPPDELDAWEAVSHVPTPAERRSTYSAGAVGRRTRRTKR